MEVSVGVLKNHFYNSKQKKNTFKFFSKQNDFFLSLDKRAHSQLSPIESNKSHKSIIHENTPYI
jgi:hypothetical protein